jgi:hypothetical protein
VKTETAPSTTKKTRSGWNCSMWVLKIQHNTPWNLNLIKFFIVKVRSVKGTKLNMNRQWTYSRLNLSS